MKIFGIGRNYPSENSTKPSSPIVFTKADTSILKNGQDFYYPSFSQEIVNEVEIVVKIDREGKNIQPKFAHKYYKEIAVGIDFTARDLIQKAKEEGLPWDIAKGFNGSAPVSEFFPIENFKSISDINFSLLVNGEVRQEGNTKDLYFTVDELIAFISTYFTLKKGDLIFTGTPVKGIAPIQIGDKLEAYLEGEKRLEVEVK